MSFSLAIALIVIADVALIAGLAFVMSRASRLAPHVSARDTGAADGGLTVTAPTPLRPTPLRLAPNSAPARASSRPQPSAA
jgi:hypothetical protein